MSQLRFNNLDSEFYAKYSLLIMVPLPKCNELEMTIQKVKRERPKRCGVFFNIKAASFEINFISEICFGLWFDVVEFRMGDILVCNYF